VDALFPSAGYNQVMSTVRIRGGRVIDPSELLDRVTDLWIKDGQLVGVGPQQHAADETIDATDCIVCPGLIDMHVHLREPGREEDETVETGTAAALAGGVTTVACMPNTEPPIDCKKVASFVKHKAHEAGNANVYPIGTVTRGRQGQELSEILLEAGAVGFTDDGSPVMRSDVMRAAMEHCRKNDRVILSHSEDLDLTPGAVMNEGETSKALGVAGYPSAAEEICIYREIALAGLTGCRLHILHVSTAEGVDLIRRAKRQGVRVTGEACPHHFLLTDESLRGRDPNFKMSPPLRTRADVEAILEGLRDGTLDVLSTDHAPHAPFKKGRGLEQAPNGILGLETFLPLCIKAFIEPGLLTWPEMIAKMTINPARVLKTDRGTLKPGAVADVTIFDPTAEWTIDPEQSRSKSRNTPFGGWKVRGRAVVVLVGGRVKLLRG
jgi:dihydroorotase